MVARVGAHANICPYLHLPVQSGSDAVLRRMGRGYTAGDYRALAARLREARAGLALSTDVIVGFPGETDDDFAETLALVSELRFAVLFAFKYSPRPGTAALRLSDEVDPAIVERRLQALLAMHSRIQLELNRELTGAELEVLVTSRGREPGRRVGRTTCHRLVHFQTSVGPGGVDRDEIEPGALVRVRIERALPHSLVAELLEVVEPSRVAPTPPRPSDDALMGEPSTERYHRFSSMPRLEGAALEGAIVEGAG